MLISECLPAETARIPEEEQVLTGLCIRENKIFILTIFLFIIRYLWYSISIFWCGCLSDIVKIWFLVCIQTGFANIDGDKVYVEKI